MMDQENLNNEVSKYRCLYDIKSEDYRDRFKKNSAWQAVALAMKSDESTCQKKWRSIRDTYVQKNKEAAEETRSGAGASNKKGWHLMPYLSFLKTVYEKRDTVSSFSSGSLFKPSSTPIHINTQETDITYTDSIFSQDSLFLNSISPISQHNFSNSGTTCTISSGDNYISEVGLGLDIDEHSYSSSSKCTNKNPEKGISRAKKRQKLSEIEKEGNELKKMLEEEKKMEALVSEKDYTDTQMFLLSLAPSLDKLEPAKKAWTQIKLQTVVAEALYGQSHS